MISIHNIDRNDQNGESFSRIENWYSILEPLLGDYLPPPELSRLKREASRKLGVSMRTLRRYLQMLKKSGVQALLRKPRSDAGRAKKVTPEIIEKAMKLLEENPHRSARKLIDLMGQDEKLKPQAQKIKPASLYPHLKRMGVDMRQKRKADRGKEYYRSFEAEHPHKLWQSDARHGIPLPDPQKPGKTKMTYAFLFLDDYSRKILFARYYFDEKLPRLEDCFRQAVLRWGLPERLYVDNGSVYISKQFTILTDSLGVRKIHHPPYQAWCKGKVERCMQVIKRFQDEARLCAMKSLDELNSALEAYVEIEHNQRLHSQTGEAPNVRFANSLDKYPPRRIKDLEKFDALFLWRDSRVVDSYGKVRLENNIYSVKGIPAGERVTVRYNPFDLARIHIYRKEELFMSVEARKLIQNKVQRVPEETKKEEKTVSKDAIIYFENLRKKHSEIRRLDADLEDFYSQLKNQDKGDDQNDRSN